MSGRLEFWHLVLAAMVMGTIFPFTMPARAAIVVDIIGKRGLQNAMALSMGGMNATRILGPTLSGLLIPVIGLAGSMSVGVALYVVAFLCLFGAFLMAFAGSPWFLLALPMVLLANICSSVFTTLNNTAIQLLIPDRVRGRISSFLMMSFGVTPLGTLPMSYVAERYGAPVAVLVAAVLVILVAAVFVASSPALRSVDARTREVLRAQADEALSREAAG